MCHGNSMVGGPDSPSFPKINSNLQIANLEMSFTYKYLSELTTAIHLSRVLWGLDT